LGGDLFTVSGADGQPRALVSSPLFERQPVLSPDGTRVAYFRGEPGGAEDAFSLVVVGIDGTGEQLLEAGGVGDADAVAWSPDGTFLLRNTGGDEIVRYDLADATRRVIVRDAFYWGDPFQPPSGDRIMYVSVADDAVLTLSNSDGSGATGIYTIRESDWVGPCDFRSMRWSPDGKRSGGRFRAVPDLRGER
jgi:Tol biopolymer transport system component